MSLDAAERPPALGTLGDRVGLFLKDVASEPEGGAVTTFVPLATVWARVRALSGRIGQSADGRSVAVTWSVVLRYRADIGPGDRISYLGRPLEIVTAADLNGRRAYLSCTCAETGMVG